MAWLVCIRGRRGGSRMISEGVRFHQIASDQGRHWLSLIQQFYTHSHAVKRTCFREEIRKNKENRPAPIQPQISLHILAVWLSLRWSHVPSTAYRLPKEIVFVKLYAPNHMLASKDNTTKNCPIYKMPLFLKYSSEFIQKLIRLSSHHYQSIHQVMRL